MAELVPIRARREEMKRSFVRMRKRWRAVLVVPSHLSGLAPHLRRKRFYPVVLPAKPLDEQIKGVWLPGRTLVTDRLEELDGDDVPVLEFSLIDVTQAKADEAALAGMIIPVIVSFHQLIKESPECEAWGDKRRTAPEMERSQTLSKNRADGRARRGRVSV